MKEVRAKVMWLFKAFFSSFKVLVENKEDFVEKWKDEEGYKLRKYKANEFTEIIGKD